MKDKSVLHGLEQGIATVYISKGMYHRALFYRLKLIADLSPKTQENEIMYWAQTAVTYMYLGMNEKALYCDNRALEGFKETPEEVGTFFYAINNTVKTLLALKKPTAALAAIAQAVKRAKPDDVTGKILVLRDFAQCYAGLKKNRLADKYFDEMLLSYNGFLDQKNNKREMSGYIINISTAVDYFISVSNYKKATEYFKRIAPFCSTTFVAIKTRVLPLEIKLDSVAGDYKKAFNDLSLYKRINDSIYDDTKSQQIAEIQNGFETTQKEHAIKLLQSQSKTQELELQTANLERNITLGGVGILLILSGLVYNRYRFKQKTFKELQAKQREINAKNESLLYLLDEKDKLIGEKDWLVKEVHHRVKNNLQTVLSLLESQAFFLKDDALNAIRVSQHRVYAMSLIHQKLYGDDQLSTIDISLYLHEFIDFLKDSFGLDDTISFNLDLQPINMSVNQAVPVALIVNEAVTNAIKYGFPDSQKGEIRVTLRETENEIELNIIDNGIGIDTVLTTIQLESMGLELMKGLTTELKGKLEINNNNGTVVSVIFNYDRSPIFRSDI